MFPKVRCAQVPAWPQLNRTMRLRTFVANRWRKMFCWMASARCRGTIACAAFRKIGSPHLGSCVLPRTILVGLRGHAYMAISRYCKGGISEERSTVGFALIAHPGLEPWQRLRRGALKSFARCA